MKFNTIYNEDCLETMRRMPDNYLHAIVTDPPYGLSFMGKAWDYDVPKVEIWREALRVLKPGGHLLAFAGSRTYHRMAVAIEDAGFEIRDQLIWMYGSGFPKSLNIGKAVDKIQGNEREVVGYAKSNPDLRDVGRISKETTGIDKLSFGQAQGAKRQQTPIDKGTSEWEGYGTALKPAHEPCVLARKPLEGTVANNVLKHGTGGLNIDGTRVETPKGDKFGGGGLNSPVNGFMGNTENTYKKGTGFRDDTALGRFPANLIHDGSDEVEAVFPQTKGVLRKPTGKTILDPNAGWNNNSMVDDTVRGFADSGSASRYFYTAKASKRERGQGNNHPTVKPIALMKYLVKLVAPPKNGIIYDPFSGSGTTLIACQKLGIDFIGSEISKEYCEIAEQRLRQEVLL